MTDAAFEPAQVRAFRFTHCSFDAAAGEARLGYAFDDMPEMVEVIRFPGAPFVLDGARADAVQRALRLLHLVAGVSYYKAAVPPEIRIEGAPIDAATAGLLEVLYENGLGEFAYRNGLDLHGRIHFRTPRVMQAPPRRPDCARTRWSPSAAARTRWSASRPCARRRRADRQLGRQRAADPQLRRAHRAADAQRHAPAAPGLFELNKRGALNGHIPVTAVNSAILALAALLWMPTRWCSRTNGPRATAASSSRGRPQTTR
jgi:hypothetical protein